MTRIAHSRLVLTELIGRGNDRECWRHPQDPSLCIKVAREHQQRAQNLIDDHYSRFLRRRKIRKIHIPRVHGWVQTNRGPGLVFDLIQQPDGSPSPPLLKALSDGLVNARQARELVNEAFSWLIDSRVILADFGIDNLLVQKRPDGRFRLMFVDGLGARNFNAAFFIKRHLGFRAVNKAKEFREKTLSILADAGY